MKKSLCAMLVLCMVLSSVPIFAEMLTQQGAITYEFADGCAYVAKYEGNEEEVIIEPIVNGYEVRWIDELAFAKCESIKRVVIPDTVETIKSLAFEGCKNLEEVVIPDSVTYLHSEVFASSANLKRVVIGNSIQSIPRETFKYCTIEKLVVSNPETKIFAGGLYSFYSHGRELEYYYPGSFESCRIDTIYAPAGSEAEKYAIESNVKFVPLELTHEPDRYNDIDKNNEIYDAVNILAALGVIDGYEDGSFRPENTLTRAEAAAIMIRLINKDGEAEKGEMAFSDVEIEHWASGYITLAAREGIINGFGNETFAPEDKVTYRQMVKMLCCVLGYDTAAQARGGWAAGGYMSIAEDIRLTKDIECENDAPITRGSTIKLIYNALELEMLDENRFSLSPSEGIVETDNDQERNIITVYFDFQYVVGDITSVDNIDNYVSMDITRIMRKSQEYYKKGDKVVFKALYGKYDDFVGNAAAAYVKKTPDGENLLLVAAKRKSAE